MADLIRRSVLIDEICRSSIYKWSVEEDQAAHNWALNIINSQPSVESSKGDYISRADAIDAVCRTRCGDKAKGCPAHSCPVIEEFDALPSGKYITEKPNDAVKASNDVINRSDAIDAVHEYFKDRLGKSKCDYDEELQLYVLGKEERTMLTYNKGINDKLRSLPSADAVQGEWEFVDNEIFAGEYFCSNCGKRAEVDLYGEWILSNYCGHCGARMKGGDGE